MAESSREMKFIEGVDLEDKNVTVEYGDVIEFEIADYVSLFYDKKKKRFYIYGIDYEDSFDEFTVDIDDNFNGLEFDGVFISRSDFEEFRDLINKVV